MVIWSFMRTIFHPGIFCPLNRRLFNCYTPLIIICIHLIIIHHTTAFLIVSVQYFRLSRLRMIRTFADDTVLNYAFRFRRRNLFSNLSWWLLLRILFILNVEVAATALKVEFSQLGLWINIIFGLFFRIDLLIFGIRVRLLGWRYLGNLIFLKALFLFSQWIREDICFLFLFYARLIFSLWSFAF